MAGRKKRCRLESKEWLPAPPRLVGLMACFREARPNGRPADSYTARYMEARPSGRPYALQEGSPTRREAPSQDRHAHGNQSLQVAFLSEGGRSDQAGGPLIHLRQDTWKPIQAGGQMVCRREAQCGRPRFQARYAPGEQSPQEALLSE